MTAVNEAQVMDGFGRYQGRTASTGYAAGIIHRLEQSRRPAEPRSAATPGEERARFAAALETTRAELAALIDKSGGEAADILAFQLALAEDETLTAPAGAAIAGGASAEAAWQAATGALVADYEAAMDEYFRARAADVYDLEARVLTALAGGSSAIDLPERAIVVAHDLPPSLFLSLDWQGRGIALEAGSPTSHVAMLARSRAVPMLVRLGPIAARTGEQALLDATGGNLLLSPDDLTERRFKARQADAEARRISAAALALKPAITAAGERVEVHLNIADPAELERLDPEICDGIGLVRTELLFHGRKTLPGENEQAAVYARMLRWAKGRPVTIRTLDAGGDKPIPGLTRDDEGNPFLGLRGVRLSLARQDIFRIQLRALLRSATEGSLKIMIPMVSVPAEMERVRALIDEVRTELEAAGTPHDGAALGMMVEVPAAALTLDLFKTDFVSIGSNDLVQYTMAAGRDADLAAELSDPANPAVLRLIEQIAAVCRVRSLPLSLCGDAGGDPQVLPMLLAAGLRSVSVAPARVAETKQAIAGYSRTRGQLGRSGLASRLGRALGLSDSRRG
jgi:phosphotransferase system enzyme I (PtsI)